MSTVKIPSKPIVSLPPRDSLETTQAQPWIARKSTLKALGIASLASQVLIVVTGGAVRLTKSGLGCDSWPHCTPEHFFPVAESSIHAFIEFGNRLMTFVLLTIAILTIRSAYRNNRRDVAGTAWWLLLGIPGQAVIGLVTVYAHLNPWVVGTHFVLSMALVVLATIQVNRIYGVVGKDLQPRYKGLSQTFRSSPPLPALARLTLVCACLSVISGILVTGSGPHAGDASAPRNGLDSDVWTKLHTLPVYILVFSSLALLALVIRNLKNIPPSHSAAARAYFFLPALMLVSSELFQAAVGYAQHLLGLPVLLVGMHLFGAALLMSSTTNIIQRIRPESE